MGLGGKDKKSGEIRTGIGGWGVRALEIRRNGDSFGGWVGRGLEVRRDGDSFGGWGGRESGGWEVKRSGFISCSPLTSGLIN